MDGGTRTGRAEAATGRGGPAPAPSGPPSDPAAGGRTPLAVDLDGALTPARLSRESALGLVSRAAPEALRRAGALAGLWRREGRAAVKAALAEVARPDPALVPWREDVLQRVRAARAEGRRTVLVSAADRRLAEAAAAHLGLFDEVHGSDGRRELVGEARAALLTERFGEGGFDWLGGADPRDAPVRAAARRAETAAAETGAGLAPWARAMRPHQWVKNLLVFAPLLSVHRFDAAGWGAAGLVFLAFCLAASSAYLINDLLDLEADRAHPVKRARPFAAGEIGPAAGALGALALLGAALAVAGTVSALTAGVVGFYYGATLLYSLALKRELVIDVCVLAGLYSLRVIGGALAVGVDLSPWILAFSTFLFLALAAMKRQGELVGLGPPGPAGEGEARGRAYRAEDLPVVTMMAIAAGYTAVLVLALYIYTPEVRALYDRPMFLWGAPPLLLYWISRMVMIAHRGGMPADPLLFALKDPISLVCAGATAAAAVLAAHGI